MYLCLFVLCCSFSRCVCQVSSIFLNVQLPRIFLKILNQRRLNRNPLNLCVCVYTRTSDDPEDQALAPKFLSTAADISCSEGDQVGLS